MAEFGWLEGERFLLQRSRIDHAEFPDSLIVFGVAEDALSMSSFDSRGMIEGPWKLSRDDSTWDDDLAITFRRR